MPTPRRLAVLLASAWLSACSAANFDLPGPGSTDDYAFRHPFFAEYCALSQIKKKVGFGADIRGEIGGHAVFYLGGACRVADAGYPVLRICPDDDPAGGVGLSMNAHFRNAKWVAVPGRQLFFDGAAPGPGGLDRAGYARTVAAARRAGIYDGVVFHDEVFAEMPPGWSPEQWRYEVSAATDYAISMGRGRYCARVSATRAQMERMVAFLNDQNAPYRAGKEFRWSVFRDNCIHLAHNALAAAGLWDEWPINRPLLVALFDFPVPRNEFVNLVRRTNDALPTDPMAAYDDASVRRMLLAEGRLPMGPGALAASYPPRRPNAVYDTDLKLIFYDDPLLGSYQSRFDAIFATPRYFDERANARHFAALYDRVLRERKPLDWWLANRASAKPGFPAVYERFYAAIGQDRAALPAWAGTP